MQRPVQGIVSTPMPKPETEVDRFAEQRQAKREQAEVYDLATPPRRGDDVSPRTCEIGVQATVDMRVIDTQTDTSLPTRVPAMWHCQVPTSIIDMSREQVADAGEDDSEDDESVAPLSSDEDLGPSESPVVAGPSNDTSQEVASHLPDEAGESRNVSETVTDMETEDVPMVSEHAIENYECEEEPPSFPSPSQELIIDDDPMSPGQESVSSTQSYLSDIEDKPVDEYPPSDRGPAEYIMEIDDLGDRPPFVRDLIDKWDGLLDEGRWTAGSLYYEDGSVAEGRIDVGRLTYDESGHDRYRRTRPVHWSRHLSEHDGSMASDGRKIIRLKGFIDEGDRETHLLPQCDDDDDDNDNPNLTSPHFVKSTCGLDEAHEEALDEGISRPIDTVSRSIVRPDRKIGSRRLKLARGITVDSGAADNVIPRRMVKGKFNRIRSSKGSRAGVHYVSASSARIPNEGECDFHFQTKDGQKENYIHLPDRRG